MRYYRLFPEDTNKGGKSVITYIKRFQNVQGLSFSVGIIYSEDKLMQNFLNNFYQGAKHTTKIASHHGQLRREEIFDHKDLSVTSLRTDCLNLDSSSGYGRNNQRANHVQTKFNFCGGANHSEDFF